jgi:hypothetical protein
VGSSLPGNENKTEIGGLIKPGLGSLNFIDNRNIIGQKISQKGMK